MRILLYTGKGGVGKTSVAAATALRCAELGYRTIVISTDSAHSLADSFDVPLGPEPVSVADNLWGQELDVLHQMERNWGNVQEYIASVFAWRGLEGIVAEEMTVFPGMEELASLIEVVHLHDAGQYDVIIIDCAPTGATLQLLTIPEIGRWYLDKMFTIKRKAVMLARPLIRAVTDLPLPDERLFDSVSQLIGHLDRMQQLLTDRTLSSARLVLNPEKMVIKETQRAFMYLNLYGYSTDAIICNRILPSSITDSYFTEWHAIQENYRQMIHQSFSPLPVLDVPFFDREVVGLDMLRRMGRVLFAERDPAALLYSGAEPRVIKDRDVYALRLPLPFVSGQDVDVTRSSQDELIVRIGNHKRVISLPHTLSALTVQSARLEAQELQITFARPSV